METFYADTEGVFAQEYTRGDTGKPSENYSPATSLNAEAADEWSNFLEQFVEEAAGEVEAFPAAWVSGEQTDEASSSTESDVREDTSLDIAGGDGRPLLVRGSKGPEVGRAQQLLNRFLAVVVVGPGDCVDQSPVRIKEMFKMVSALRRRGQLPLVVDGLFGPNTEEATNLFQACLGLVRDGKIGPVTWHYLEKYPQERHFGDMHPTSEVEPHYLHEAPISSEVDSGKLTETHWEVDESKPEHTPPTQFSAAEAQQPVTKAPTYRIKARLEHPDLANIPRLQDAVSAEKKAMNVGVDSGEGVRALQSALRKLHYRAGDGSPVPLSGVYDAATQSAVAALQRDSGIPYPTGRQAGPKTLSALDDRLLKGQPKPDDSACITYRPGEREAAKSSAGKVADHGQELRLYNFAVASPRAKPEHERAVNEFVQKYSLFDPDHSEWQISEVVGFSDAVDNEEKNSDLRATRAADVRFILTRNGVPDTAMAGVDRAASLLEYQRGCTPGSRSWDRSVVIRLRWKRPKPHPDPRPKPDTNPDWQPAGICKAKPSTKWSIRGNAAVSSPSPLIVAVHGNFTLTDRISGKWRILSFTGTGGQIGKSFPLSVGIDNPTDFETTSPQYFENFEGQGAIIFGEAMFVVGYAIGRMLMHPHTEPGFISGSGFQLGLGADVTFVGGKWYFDPALGMTCHGGVQSEIEPVGEAAPVTTSARQACSCMSHESSTGQSSIAATPHGVPPTAEFASGTEQYEGQLR